MTRPYLSTFTDRHGASRWRFRRGRVSAYLPGEPGEAAFEAAYAALLDGAPLPPAAPIARLEARSLRECWRRCQQGPEWRRLRPISRETQTRVAERFLARPVAGAGSPPWGAMPVADLKRRHVKLILAEMADTPHAADQVLRLIRKLIGQALDDEWVEVDPTHRLKWSPPTEGHRAWTDVECATFEARHPVGSAARLVYALGLWSGLRRADITRLRWVDIADGRVTLTTGKTGQRVAIRIIPALAEALDATPRRGETVLTTYRGDACSEKALTERMRTWVREAGLSGCTLHGLRATLATRLRDLGADLDDVRPVLGHATTAMTRHYARDSDNTRASDRAMTLLARAMIKPAS